MVRMRVISSLFALAVLASGMGLWGAKPATAAENNSAAGNQFAYLDESDPFYVSRTFPKLITPQWVGEDGVEAVVILSIDDMRGHERWEEFLRPLLERLKKIDGRAPVSIMTCQIDPREPHLQKWLAEGVSLETHTLDHPCPLLQKGDLAAAKQTYDRCIDQMDAISGSRSVAFRMPCCDSQNTPSPRFYTEIFGKTTPLGNFLEIDSSVFNITTGSDPEVPRELVVDGSHQEIFRRYLPFKSYVVTVEDYPYPYVIGGNCWEFPCAVPSDWSAQHVQKPDNPRTLEDMKRGLDAAVAKKGVFTLVFHPHKWIKAEQLVELVDHAVAKHGNKVKFLTFREASERINKNLLGGQPLRLKDGSESGTRLVDLNADGYMDVVAGGPQLRRTRVWSPEAKSWTDTTFPVDLTQADARFGLIHDDGRPTVFDGPRGAWHFDGTAWVADVRLTRGLNLEGKLAAMRLVDIDGDGTCELIARGMNKSARQSVYRRTENAWELLPFMLPENMWLPTPDHDTGLRFVDLDQNGTLDVLYSNDTGYAAALFTSLEKGWSQELVRGKPGDQNAIPMIAREGKNNGAWINGRTLWVQNENTDKLPDLVDRLPLDKLLESVKFPGPKSPEMALKTMRVRPGFQVELAAAEPLTTDPVSIAFGPDGKLWVAEMGDYPRGTNGRGAKGGVVRYLEDTDGDGRYDKSTRFLDDLGYPNGVTPWRNGVLITCAPEVIYAEDTDGDGKADKREVLYSGFMEGNPQHRANGFAWGMDGWLYGAHAESETGGIKLHKRGDEVVDANGRDFRIRPDEGLLDPQSGVSQYGRSRDDWDNWFGNENSNPLYHYVLADHYLRRNDRVPAIDGKVDVSDQPGVAEVFPASRTLARYNDLYAANRFTSANSAIIYRDDLFGPTFEGNSFVSEPVHNLVHREILRPDGLTFHSRRAADEIDSEFLASADNWFRPATLVTGPDGALWVTDMYRQTIEHPQWIPFSVQKQVDLRAGSDKGRIYRVAPVGSERRPIPRLDKLSTAELVAALDSPSGWQRDMVQQMLLWKPDPAAHEPLHKLAAESKRPITRAQALWTLELLGQATPEEIAACVRDEHPGVRRQAIRIAERHLAKSPALGDALLERVSDTDPQVKLQVAYTLGAWDDPRAGKTLGELALANADNRYMTAAVLSSVTPKNLAGVTEAVLAVRPPAEPPAELLEQLVGLATAYNDETTLAAALKRIGAPHKESYAAWQLTALAGLLDALARSGTEWQKYDPDQSLAKMFAFARETALNDAADEGQRLRAIRLLGRSPASQADDVGSLVALLVPQTSGAVQAAAVESLARIDSDTVPPALLSGWKGHGPELRSQILEVLLSRPSGQKALLAAIERDEIPAADIDAARRQRLQQSDEESIRSQAEKLLAGGIESNRAQVVEQFRSILATPGDAAAGVAVFTKRCAVCHRLRGVGIDVGPDLASLTDLSPETLLVAILDPNKAVEAKFRDYLALTTTGLTHTGLLASETGNSVTLMGQEGKQQTILRSDLETLQATGKSLMPEGLEKDMSPQDLANVIAHVRGSGAPRKVFEANQPRLVTPTTDGTLQLYPTNCEIYGPTIVMEQLYKNLGLWKSENDKAVWNVELPKAGKFQMVLNYASLDEDAGNGWILEVQPSGTPAAGADAASPVGTQLTGTVVATGSIDRYVEVIGGEIELPAGPQQITLRAAGPPRGKLLQLGGVLLKPVK